MTAPAKPTEPGRGIYLPAQAARLAQLDDDRVRRWVRGYDFKGRGGEKRHSDPLFQRQHQGERLALTFLDLVEVLFVKAFLDHGVSIQTVRLVQREAADEFGVQHPFCVKRFETDGETIVLRHRDDAGIERMMDRKRKQWLFVKVFNPLLKTLEYAGVEKEATRWWPMGKETPIVLDPARSFGQAIVSKANVPTATIYAARRARESEEQIADWYELTLEEVRAAIAFEESRSRRPAAA
jgi:uncharacterized protein (DUF433 family)